MKHILSSITKVLAVALLATVISVSAFSPTLAAPASHESSTGPVLVASHIEGHVDGELENLRPEGSETSTGTFTAPSQTTTCESSFIGLGWILCQISDAIYGMFDWLIQNVLAEQLLEIDLIDDNQELRATWENFRTLANWIFVIVFLVIIYAEATGRVGALETFSVTRLLPRLAFAVIGLQLSYFIVGYAIEVFNDFGAGITQLVLAPVDGLSRFDFRGIFQPFTEGSTFWGIPIEGGGDFFDNLVTVPVIAAAGIGVYLFFTAAIMYGVIGLLLLFLTLVARKLIIVALVILSPVAFALYVLPSTEKYFRQWWDVFLKALIMYPLIMVFIASGSLLGRLAIAGDEVNIFNSLIGLVATFLPFFLIPVTFRLAGNAITAISGGLSNLSEKAKGDVRDPNSMRSLMKQRRGQKYGRLMGGEARIPFTNQSVLPRSVRRAYNRIPGVDSSASLMADIIGGRKAVDDLTATLGDDIIRAAAVTGGGARRGQRVKTAEGSHVYSGYAQLGKHLAYNGDGSVMTNAAGVAQMMAGTNSDGTAKYKDASSGQFYDNDVMSQVRKYSINRGFLQASSEYAMTKTTDEDDQAQVWSGLDGSKWSKGEKVGIANGVWYRTKGDNLHNKFGDFGGYFHDGSYDVAGNRRMNTDFKKLIGYVDEKTGQYDLSKQQGTFWRASAGGLRDYVGGNGITAGMSAAEIRNQIGDEDYNQINNMAWKAQGMINSTRPQRSNVPDSDGNLTGEALEQLSGSQAVGAAARGAESFLIEYERHFGKLPSPSGIEKRIQPGGR